MLKISVCPAVAEDAEIIARLNEESFGQTTAVPVVRAQIRSILESKDERLLVAVYHGTMIGYIHTRIDRRTYRAPRELVLCVAVDKEYRRKGVASALFRYVEEQALSGKAEAMSAAVGGSRAAQSFFAAVGCEERLNRKQYNKFLGDTSSDQRKG